MFHHSNNEYHLITDESYQEVIDDQDEIVCKIYAFTRNGKRDIFYHCFGIFLLGIPYLIFGLFIKVKTAIKYERCSLRNATILLVYNNHGTSSIENVTTEIIRLPNSEVSLKIRYFFHQHSKYVFMEENECFTSHDQFVSKLTLDNYLNNVDGLLESEYSDHLKFYGPNKIEVEVKSYSRLFIEEVFNPFYLFQCFSVILWLVDDYVIYAGCVVFLTLFSSVTSLVQTRKQSEALHELVERSKCHEVQVLRQNDPGKNTLSTIDPVELVPGDLVVLPAANFVMPCDAVLITGQCIVNESVLTGESVPVTKTALHSSNEVFNIDAHKRHVLFAGTNVLQTRYYGGEYVLARVVRTSFDTTKGALVKSILFPSPVNLQFYKDSFKFVGVLFSIALSGMVYCLYLYIRRGADLKDIVVRTLDIITIVVPPALPAALAVGTVYSQQRLKKAGIFCISPPRINVCGKVKLACFDKTGTLTNDGLDMNSVVPCYDSEFGCPVTYVSELDVTSKLVQAMSTCHSLTTIGGELNGDPLDLNMFEFTKWVIEEPGNENARYDMLAPTIVMPKQYSSGKLLDDLQNEMPYQIGIIRQFPFSSSVQCMSVICKNLQTPNMTVFTKGAPEKIQSMCHPDTIPKDFSKRLSQYTAQGYRVIALGYKDLPKKFKWKDAQKVKRDMIECDLNFLGLLIMQNTLKEETAPVIRTLHKANIKTVMITGDNILTAISVARECGMVGNHDPIFVLSYDENDSNIVIEKAGAPHNSDHTVINFNYAHHHFAIDGKTWHMLRSNYSHLIPGLLVRGKIFARFQPDQKTQLVSSLQSLGYVVSMVGDGANDCGALKAAHVGVSLSQEEASVAAPFTSSIPNISCIVKLILEGRCALVTSFAIFKYMALYSLIQFITILILYRNHSILGDYQFLFIDLIITTSLAVTMGRQGPHNVLCAKRPTSSLVAGKTLIPMLLHIATCAFIQLGALYFLYWQEWFEPIPPHGHEETILSWENTVLFTVSCYQYIILAAVFSKGRPYREMLITNFWFLFSAVFLTAVVTWLVVYPCKEVARAMEIMDHNHEHMEFRIKLLALPMAHLLLAAFIEAGIGDRSWLKRLIQFLICKKTPKNKYKVLLQDKDFLEYLNSLPQRKSS